MSNIKLRHYQAESTPLVEKYLAKHPMKHPLVALPTGAGKTYCIADLIQSLRARGEKILVLSHVKEILEQNYKAIKTYLPSESVGVNSSMLKRREIKSITVAGIQSVYNDARKFKRFKYVIIDEAHLISVREESMYAKFFAGIGEHSRIGFTGTPFRLGTGKIYGASEETAFSRLVCDWTKTDKFNRLIEEGYLCKLTTKRTELEMDTSAVKMTAGDFNEKSLSDAFDRESVTNAAIKEIMTAGAHRNKWMIFAIDITHAEHIAEVLIRNGIPTALVHSKMKDSGFDRGRSIQDYKDGKYKCVVNVNILTTGFDDPGIDLIACLRPTHSPVLHVQSLGRGSRTKEGKKDCLVLDFAGNTARLGPINNPLVKVAGKGKGGGEPITKVCPDCDSILAPAVKFCPDCNYEFKFEHGLSALSSNYDVIEDGKPHWIKVAKVDYELNSKFGAPSSVKVTYTCGNKSVSEFICLEHKGFAKQKADHWVRYRGGDRCNTAADLIAQKDKIRQPQEVLVQKKGKYYVVNNASFEEIGV